MKVVIVGGVALGASALARLKRLKPESHVIMFEKDEYPSFANCGLPYYLGGVIKDRSKLIVTSKEALMNRTKAEVRNFSEVIRILRDTKEVEVLNHQTKETYKEQYDYLILGPGASPFVPKIDGLDQMKHVYTVRNIADVDQIEARINEGINHVTIVGSGFIGVEMAENMKHRGLNVDVLELGTQILAPFDDEMAKLLSNEMILNGINIHFGTSIKSIQDHTLTLTNDTTLQTDMIIMAIGVVPETKLAKEAKLEIGALGGIKVNVHMQTSDPYIYAGGDAIEVNHFILNEQTKIPLAWPANRQGRLIADHIAGVSGFYAGTQGTSVLKVFELTGAATGINEKTAKQKGIPYQAFHIVRGNHAGYYPDAKDIIMKVLYHKETKKVLGAQAVGPQGTDKRIDVVATAIHFGATIEDLQALELTYAPPYSSAKDPVNIAGYVGQNIEDGLNHPFYVQDIEMLKGKAQIIDVRTKEEFESGHIEGAINIPVDDLICQKDRIDFNAPVYVMCRVGLRGYVAATQLRALGFEQPIYNLSGGYKLYEGYVKYV